MLRHRFALCFYFAILLLFSAPLSRLTPIEALPQAPQWALPLDPTSPLASGLSLRFIARFARCFICFALYEGILILLALYHQYWIAVKIWFHGFRIFVGILKYLICQLVSRFRQLLYGLFIHSRTDR